jgi:hypothetical protein
MRLGGSAPRWTAWCARTWPVLAYLAQGPLNDCVCVFAACVGERFEREPEDDSLADQLGDPDAATGGRLGELSREIVGESDADRAYAIQTIAIP